jgi:stringent starvation protein B
MLSSKRSYLFRAMFDWILENQLTPHIVVDTTKPQVQVPPAYIEDNKITLNLAPLAVTGFAMGQAALEFKARFDGRLLHVYVPYEAIIAIYALENNHCLVFGAEEIHQGILVNMGQEGDAGGDSGGTPPPVKRPKGPPKLHIVK